MAAEKVDVYRKYHGPVPTDSSGICTTRKHYLQVQKEAVKVARRAAKDVLKCDVES